MDVPDLTTQQALDSLDPPRSVARIVELSTLPHSSVSRITFDDGRSVILKRAGSADFANGIRRELLINRDVLAELPDRVAPALLSSNAETELPWMLFEDISASHRALSVDSPPAYEHIEKLVRALASSHTQSSQLDLTELFSSIQGDIHVTGGSAAAAPVLDEFLHNCDRERFPQQTFDLIRKIRDNVPHIVQLLIGPEVLVHGDAHFGNAMYGDDALLLDWAMSVIGPGEVDLCHALAMNLPRSLASRYEPEALRAYVQTCAEFGADPGEQEVLDRYRRCLLLTVIVATGMKAVPGISDSVWSFLFSNAVQSAIDHDALSFLG